MSVGGSGDIFSCGVSVEIVVGVVYCHVSFQQYWISIILWMVEEISQKRIVHRNGFIG